MKAAAASGAGNTNGPLRFRGGTGGGEGYAIPINKALSIAKELPELRLIDGERLGAPFGEWRVAVVEIVGNVAEQERRREG